MCCLLVPLLTHGGGLCLLLPTPQLLQASLGLLEGQAAWLLRAALQQDCLELLCESAFTALASSDMR